MAVGGKNDFFGAGHAAAEHGKNAFHVFGDGVADGVRDVDGGGTRDDGGFDAAAQKVRFGAAAVFGGPFHVVHEFAGEGDGGAGEFEDRVRLHFQLVFHVERAGGEEDVDAFALRRAHGLGGAQDVVFRGAGEAGDDGAFDLLGDAFDAFEVALGGDGEAGFQDVHAEFGQGFGHAEFFVDVHGEAGRLFAVAQGGIEDDNAVFGDVAEIGVGDGHFSGVRFLNAVMDGVRHFP